MTYEVTSLHGKPVSFLDIDLPLFYKCVTYVSEHVLPVCPGYTQSTSIGTGRKAVWGRGEPYDRHEFFFRSVTMPGGHPSASIYKNIYISILEYM